MHEDEIPVGRATDLRGKVFGRLTVLYRVENKGNSVTWKCKCECGNIKEIIGSSLTTGNTLSCGCYNKEKISNDLTGKRFGKLVAIKPTGNKRRRYIEWECLCDCGNTAYVASGDLNYGSVTSCGCKNDIIDITGQRFGTLTVLRLLDEKGPTGQAIWECQCDCGKIVKARGTSLRYGEVSSCGSAACRGLEKDMTGMVFGKLTVISKSDFKNSYSNHTYWNCKCECGNTCIVMGANLRKGHTTSCGCKITVDITGKRFGKLVAIKPTEQRNKNGGILWECKCDCGRTHYATPGNLNYGKLLSCGCLLSKGEEVIGNLLEDADIIYKSQKTFESCRFDDTGALARFDFYIDEEYLIEFDGIQHFEYKNSGWDTEEHFEKIQKRDEYKNQWCKDNNIPLIRIPYTKLDTLCIEDLMLETTQFRVV